MLQLKERAHKKCCLPLRRTEGLVQPCGSALSVSSSSGSRIGAAASGQTGSARLGGRATGGPCDAYCSRTRSLSPRVLRAAWRAVFVSEGTHPLPARTARGRLQPRAALSSVGCSHCLCLLLLSQVHALDDAVLASRHSRRRSLHRSPHCSPCCSCRRSRCRSRRRSRRSLPPIP